MSYQSYDREIARIIKIMRQLRGVKQIVVANCLHISQSAYSKIEKGSIAITPGQLEVIAFEIRIPVWEILLLAKMNKTELAIILSQLGAGGGEA